ncbi:metal-dependent hydrolase [Marinomonas ostreistagni]|uniref:metal-dependent hydrolase n=1 Tax=Marinomonas ostreistagni TaxID=359209 RepID=UPI001951FBD0|nr:metal-dependent hydrolase [Marinomonas ostreistagni]MBM6550745.1 metal-dependent hydrolase [Marinomonas ostreistagni]
MADFKTHVSVAAALSIPLAAGTYFFHLASLTDALLYALAGTLGGMLPDIDADESIAIRIVFRLFGALTAAVCGWLWFDELLIWHVLALALASYFVVRIPVQWVFERLTDHRGVLHSLLANVLFTVVAVPIAYHVLGLSAKTAWGIGAFIFFGATVHLILDEVYSIDLSGMRVKRSFGTALKLTDWKEPLASLIFVVACGVGYWLSPGLEAWQQSLLALTP